MIRGECTRTPASQRLPEIGRRQIISVVSAVEGGCQLSVGVPTDPRDGEIQQQEPVKGHARHGSRRDVPTHHDDIGAINSTSERTVLSAGRLPWIS